MIYSEEFSIHIATYIGIAKGRFELFLYIDTSICLQEIDGDWNISWPPTTRGEVALQKCPGGAESLGMHQNLTNLLILV